jgi:hypothetical protein
MLPTSVTSRALTFTQAVLDTTTRVTYRVVYATTRVHDVVVDATTRVHNKAIQATTRVRDRVERVHLDAVDRDYRAKYTHEEEIQVVVDKSRAVKDLRDKVADLDRKQQMLTVLCIVLAVCNFLQLHFLSSR